MVRKCGRGIAVMEVGVRTRSRAALAMAVVQTSTTAKRSKKVKELPKPKRKPKTSGDRKDPSSDEFDSEAQVSCCSSNSNEDGGAVDLESNEVETSTYNSHIERRDMTPSSKLREESEGLESTTKAITVSVSVSPLTVAEKSPSELELEEFFSSAEKNIQKLFAEKYNFDIVKDTPLEGRYEWVRLNPRRG